MTSSMTPVPHGWRLAVGRWDGDPEHPGTVLDFYPIAFFDGLDPVVLYDGELSKALDVPDLLRCQVSEHFWRLTDSRVLAPGQSAESKISTYTDGEGNGLWLISVRGEADE